MLQTGDKAPYFEGPDQDGNIIRLSDFTGRRLVLYFYPKDSAASHRKFIEKYSLPVPLISDPETVLLQAYEAWGEKKNYGKVSMGTLRKTYVIDENGIITDIISKVDTKNHTAQILK